METIPHDLVLKKHLSNLGIFNIEFVSYSVILQYDNKWSS